MRHVVGDKDRSEFVLDPVEAWRRGRQLDRMLPALPPPPRGVLRATHAELNRMDDARAAARARLLNARRAG